MYRSCASSSWQVLHSVRKFDVARRAPQHPAWARGSSSLRCSPSRPLSPHRSCSASRAQPVLPRWRSRCPTGACDPLPTASLHSRHPPPRACLCDSSRCRRATRRGGGRPSPARSRSACRHGPRPPTCCGCTAPRSARASRRYRWCARCWRATPPPRCS